jgi:hypothetical protein
MSIESLHGDCERWRGSRGHTYIEVSDVGWCRCGPLTRDAGAGVHSGARRNSRVAARQRQPKSRTSVRQESSRGGVWPRPGASAVARVAPPPAKEQRGTMTEPARATVDLWWRGLVADHAMVDRWRGAAVWAPWRSTSTLSRRVGKGLARTRGTVGKCRGPTCELRPRSPRQCRGFRHRAS